MGGMQANQRFITQGCSPGNTCYSMLDTQETHVILCWTYVDDKPL